MELNRAAFLAGSLAALSVAIPRGIRGSESVPEGLDPDKALAELMAGNKRFVENDFPPLTKLDEKRELLVDSQAPFAAILGCADSRVIPNIVFVQGIGDLFVVRVAGNYPDGLVVASLEYAVEHLGTRLIMVLGHQNCGAVKAVYSAIQTRTDLPRHLSTIERLIEPGIENVVRARGSMMDAIEANVRAADASLKATPPILTKALSSGHVKIVGAVYELGTGKVNLID